MVKDNQVKKDEFSGGQPSALVPVSESLAKLISEGKSSEFRDFENLLEGCFLGTESGRFHSRASFAWQAIRFPMTPLDKAYQIYVLRWMTAAEWKPYIGDHNASAFKAEMSAIRTGLSAARNYLMMTIPELIEKSKERGADKYVDDVLEAVFSQQYPGISGRDPYAKKLTPEQQKMADLIGSHYGENLYIRAHPERLDLEIASSRELFGDNFKSLLGKAETDAMKKIKDNIRKLWPGHSFPDIRKKISVFVKRAKAERIAVRAGERDLMVKLFSQNPSPSLAGLLDEMRHQSLHDDAAGFRFRMLEKASLDYCKLVNQGGLGWIWRDAQILARNVPVGTGFDLSVSKQNPDVRPHPVEVNAKIEATTSNGQMGLF